MRRVFKRRVNGDTKGLNKRDFWGMGLIIFSLVATIVFVKILNLFHLYVKIQNCIIGFAIYVCVCFLIIPIVDIVLKRVKQLEQPDQRFFLKRVCLMSIILVVAGVACFLIGGLDAFQLTDRDQEVIIIFAIFVCFWIFAIPLTRLIIKCYEIRHKERRQIKEGMKKDVMPNFLVIFISSIVVGTIFFLVKVMPIYIFDETSSNAIIGFSVYMYVWLLVFPIIGIFGKKNFNKYLNDIAYGFFYSKEFFIYKNVGNRKTIKEKYKRKYGIDDDLFPEKYSLWKSGIEKRNYACMNNYDFYRFLMRMIRNKNTEYSITVAVAIPIEITIAPAIVSKFDGINETIIFLLLTSIFLVIVLTNVLNTQKESVSFLEDVVEVLAHDCKKKDAEDVCKPKW